MLSIGYPGFGSDKLPSKIHLQLDFRPLEKVSYDTSGSIVLGWIQNTKMFRRNYDCDKEKRNLSKLLENVQIVFFLLTSKNPVMWLLFFPWQVWLFHVNHFTPHFVFPFPSLSESFMKPLLFLVSVFVKRWGKLPYLDHKTVQLMDTHISGRASAFHARALKSVLHMGLLNRCLN